VAWSASWPHDLQLAAAHDLLVALPVGGGVNIHWPIYPHIAMEVCWCASVGNLTSRSPAEAGGIPAALLLIYFARADELPAFIAQQIGSAASVLGEGKDHSARSMFQLPQAHIL
jgi:hypothetical protein